MWTSRLLSQANSTGVELKINWDEDFIILFSVALVSSVIKLL